MTDNTGSTEPTTPLDDIVGRMADLEAGLERLDVRLEEGVTTRRLAIVDSSDRERLVAEVVDDTLELRIDLPRSREGRRTSLLCFATPGLDQLCAGVGVQLWVDGDIVDEMAWWADQPPHG